MPALQVRDLPQDIYEGLVRRASEEHRSLAQQTVAILEAHLSQQDSAACTQESLDKPNRKGGQIQDAELVEFNTANTAQPLFTPFEANGITYLAPPDETQEQRAARKQRFLAGISQKPHAGAYDDLPPAADIIQSMREERLDQLVSETGDSAW